MDNGVRVTAAAMSLIRNWTNARLANLYRAKFIDEAMSDFVQVLFD